MEKDSSLTNKNLFQCYYNNVGYCKYREQWRYQHFNDSCQKSVCLDKTCKFRHPKTCKHGDACKFFMKKCCAFSHRKDDRLIGDLENEIINLKTEIRDLTEGNKQKEEKLNKIPAENSERINILIKENDDMTKYIEETKKSNAEEIKLKDTEIKMFKEQNKFKSEKILELETQIAKNNPKERQHTSLKDVKDDENAKQRDNFICDKCGFNTSSLPLLIKHKTNEHNPVMSCNQCDFKSFKKSDLQLREAFKH